MKTSRFSEPQIVAILRQAEGGVRPCHVVGGSVEFQQALTRFSLRVSPPDPVSELSANNFIRPEWITAKWKNGSNSHEN
ncbi:hypothetical protein [Rhizobium leguminosarum]|uniref:hypothetical protein n=1 Tax=Rhizobium leguminosarum TaxID=384 RepID=UPI00144115E3|nr:hypothetical protein [Rhizobium leguminosarum]MBY5868650.1 hypothetical protein [Rhizobium leguminosarum]NKM08022.1 hypothetical protein [Rhizobium leguminosarum bv. viciae]